MNKEQIKQDYYKLKNSGATETQLKQFLAGRGVPVDRILKGQYVRKQLPQRTVQTHALPDVSEELRVGDIQRNYRPTGAMDVRTSAPVKTLEGGGGDPANFSAYIKAGFVDDLKKQIPIFAESRFPKESKEKREARYGIRNGEIIYVKSGKVYSETPDIGSDIIKRGVGMEVAHLPKDILAAVGAYFGGVPGAAVGAGAGEMARKFVGSDQFSGGDVVDIGVAAGFGALGSIGGKTGNVAKRAMTKGGFIKEIVGHELARGNLTPKSFARAAALAELAGKHNIKLKPHQLLDNQAITTVWKKLKAHPATSHEIRRYERELAKDIEAAGEAWLERIRGVSEVSEDLVSTAGEIGQKRVAARTKATKPFYEKSKSDFASLVDVRNKIGSIDAPPGSTLKRELDTISKQLELGSADFNTIERIDYVKKYIDSVLEKPVVSGRSVDKPTRSALAKIKAELTTAADAASPDYAKGRLVHQKLTPWVEETTQGTIGRIAAIKNDKQALKAALNELFSPANINAEKLTAVKKIIQKENPRLWDESVGAYIKSRWNKLKLSGEGQDVLTVARNMQQQFEGKEQKRILKAAMGPAYESFNDMLTIFKHAAIGSGKTETLSAVGGQVDEALKSLVYSFIRWPAGTAAEATVGGRNIRAGEKGARKMFNFLMNPKAISKIRQMKKISPKSNKFREGLVTLATMMDLERAARVNPKTEDTMFKGQ